MRDSKPSRLPSVQLPDHLRHFSRDGPFVRLVALLICKLPSLFSACAVALLAASKLL